MKSFRSLFLVLATAWPAFSQQLTPAIVVQREGKTESLGLAELAIEVRIVGYVAETSVTMTFANPLPQNTEGDLYFPLPAGATVSGYALDIQGKMVDGVSVERQYAREVFEQEKRRRVDPGLVEWTKGNWFRTRVFPIPAKGRRIVRVQYLSELVDAKDGCCYRLPLRITHAVPEFSLRVEVVQPAVAPSVRQSAVANFQFSKWRENFLAETKITDAVLDKDLVIAVPDVEKQNARVERAEDGSVYFALQDVPTAPQTDRPRVVPKHVAIYWDASGSRASIDHQQEIQLVATLFAAWTAQASGKRGPVKVDLVLIRNVQSPPQRFTITAKGISQLTDALKCVDYDGGTQLGAIARIEGAKPDMALLFSDGISTFGHDESRPLDTPLYVFSADAGADGARLQHLANANNGRYFNLSLLNVAEVVDAVGQPAYSLLSATVKGGHVSDLLPAAPHPIGGHLTLVGRLDDPQALVTLRYGFAGEVVRERTLAVDCADAMPGQVLRRLWAQKKLEELLVFHKENQEQIATLGRQYGLVTPFNSLMVLESLEQYVQYRIEPPVTLPEMRADYLRRLGEQQKQESIDRDNKIEEVVRLWQTRVLWWDTLFTHPSRPKHQPASPARPTMVQPNMGQPFGFGSPAVGRVYGMGAASGASGMSGSMGGSFGGAMGGMAGGTGGGMRGGIGGGMKGGLGGAGLGGMGGGGGFGGAIGGMGGGRMGGEIGGQAGGMAGAEGIVVAGGQAVPVLANYEISPRNVRRGPRIELRAWDPAAPYLRQLRAAPSKEAFAVYLKNRAQYSHSPAYFLDCADYFFDHRDPDLAIQVLSNLAEMELDNPVPLRILGHRLAQIGHFDLAVLTFEEVVRMRPQDPQSYRDLGLVLAQRADAAAGLQAAGRGSSKTPHARPVSFHGDNEMLRLAIGGDYARAIKLLTNVVERRWDRRFTEIELPVLMELNRILVRAKAYGVKAAKLDPRLIKPLDLDVRIVVTSFDSDDGTNMEVAEPLGEKAGKNHAQTAIGGLIGRPWSTAGPVEYLLHKAINGKYVVRASDAGNGNPVLGPLTVRVEVYTQFGRENEECRSLMIRLKNGHEPITVGQVKF